MHSNLVVISYHTQTIADLHMRQPWLDIFWRMEEQICLVLGEVRGRLHLYGAQFHVQYSLLGGGQSDSVYNYDIIS